MYGMKFNYRRYEFQKPNILLMIVKCVLSDPVIRIIKLNCCYLTSGKESFTPIYSKVSVGSERSIANEYARQVSVRRNVIGILQGDRLPCLR